MLLSVFVLRMLIDKTTQYLPAPPGSANGQFYVEGEIQIEDCGKAYSGYGTYIGGWNNGTWVDTSTRTSL